MTYAASCFQRLGPSDLKQETEDYYIAYTLDRVLSELFSQVKLALNYEAKSRVKPIPVSNNERLLYEQQIILAQTIVQDFANTLPDIRRLLDADVCAAYEGDPAAHSVDEGLTLLSGIFAIIYHRIAHQLYPSVPLLSRIISELHILQQELISILARKLAKVFIDHGTGVVIGETSVIGEYVRIYQVVTLGAKRFEITDDGALKKIMLATQL
jgi:serine O-acetyltransferase